jgi:spore coat protein H
MSPGIYDSEPSSTDWPTPLSSPRVTTPPVTPPTTPELPALQTQLETYELQMPQETYDQFMADPYTAEQPMTLVARGQSYRVVGRLRGASARTFPKKSWKLDFDPYLFDGRRKLNLIAEYQDCTMVAEKLAYDLLHALGGPAPKAEYIRLKINGKLEGVFLSVEQIDKQFLNAHKFADRDASIYRCGWKDCEMKTWKVGYQGNWQKKTNETEPSTDLQQVLETINHTSEPRLAATLPQVLEVEALLRSMTLDVLMSNDYVEDSESYFVHDRVTGRWTYVPWDLNNVDARWWYTYTLDAKPIVNHPLFSFTLLDGWTERIYQMRKDQYPGYLPVFSNLGTRVLLNPELRNRLVQSLEQALGTVFTTQALSARIDAIYTLIGPTMAEDPYIDQAKFQAGRAYAKGYVSGRVQFLRAQLDAFKKRKPGLVLEAFNPTAGWVELKNRGAEVVSTEGLVVTTNLRDAVRASNVPTLTLQPGERVRVMASTLGLTFPAQGEIGLFNGRSVVGMLDALFYGPTGVLQRDATGQWTESP